jgi:hypothetical protein
MLNPIRGMEIYIEKEILEKLNKDFLFENLTVGQNKWRELLESYDELELCTNVTFEALEFETYKFENPLFNKIIEKSLVKSFDSLSEFIIKSTFRQSIIIDSKENYKNRDLIESKGGLYFTYDNFSEKTEEIINYFHKKIDLSKKFEGWPKVFNKTFLKLNEIVINDNYIIDDSNSIDNHIIPLINAVKKQCKLDRIIFFTDYLNKTNYQKEQKEILLNNRLNKLVKIYHNNFRGFSNHDRLLYTNFLIVDCPIGFNKIKISNSVITFETIFDRFTYNRRRRHYREIESLLK